MTNPCSLQSPDQHATRSPLAGHSQSSLLLLRGVCAFKRRCSGASCCSASPSTRSPTVRQLSLGHGTMVKGWPIDHCDVPQRRAPLRCGRRSKTRIWVAWCGCSGAGRQLDQHFHPPHRPARAVGAVYSIDETVVSPFSWTGHDARTLLPDGTVLNGANMAKGRWLIAVNPCYNHAAVFFSDLQYCQIMPFR